MWISKVGHTVLVRLMEFQMWSFRLPPVWGEGSAKGQWPLLTRMPDTSLSPYMPLVPFKLPPRWQSSEGASLSRWVCEWVSWEELPGAPAAPSTNPVPTCLHSQKLWGLIFLALGSWDGGPGVGLGLLPNFYLLGCVASPFCVRAPPTSLDGCGFFNSVVVRLPFNLISDIPEWWLFCILLIILMWLREEVSHVDLCCHLDQKPPIAYIFNYLLHKMSCTIICSKINAKIPL